MHPGDPGNLPGKLDVPLGHPHVVVGGRDQAHGHAVVAQIDIGLVVVEAGQLGNRLDEPSACREGVRGEIGMRPVAEHTPILGALGVMELLYANWVGHAVNLPACRAACCTLALWGTRERR